MPQQLVQPGHGAARAVALHQLQQQRGLAAQQARQPQLRAQRLQRLQHGGRRAARRLRRVQDGQLVWYHSW